MASRVAPPLRHAAPLLAAVAVAALLGFLLPLPDLIATKLLLACLLAALAATGWARTQRVARQMARFVNALRKDDLAQSFRMAGEGRGHAELGEALDRMIARLRQERASGLAERRFAAALADEAPTPLLSIAEDNSVRLANKAARRLFQESDGRTIAAFARYGEGFADALAAVTPGGRVDTRVRWNGLDQRAVLAAAVVEREGRPSRIVSVNIIQRELDAAELSTQTDLVRVLTHEIMNSLTPVTSLAATAALLMERAREGDADALGDATVAIDTLARRASGIAHFVESYREFGRSPTVNKAPFAVRPWLDELLRSFSATPPAQGVALAASVEPGQLRLDGDATLLGQVLLNLLRNAAQAARGERDDAAITLAIRQDDAGRVRLTVADNGPGVPAALRDEIFLPFFTTKRTGTGIGLSFARQVAMLHGGVIGLAPDEGTGATFEIIL